MDENIAESLIHYGYLVIFIVMLTIIMQYKNTKLKDDIIYILLGIGVFILSLYFLRVLNAFDLYNSIIHGLGITIAVLLLLSFINHNNVQSENSKNVLLRIGESFTKLFNDIINKLGNTTTEKLKGNIQDNSFAILVVVNILLIVIFAIVYKIKN